jgi:hypothetical protein
VASADLVACEAVTEGLALTEAEVEVDAVEEAVAEAVVALALKVGEGVVVKVLAVPGDADLLAREWEVLRALQASQIPGAAHFVTRLPVPVA